MPINLKLPCHAFPVITRPLVCYEGFYACKRSAESKTLKVHPVGSKTLTPPQNASLELSHVLPGHCDVWIPSSHAQCYDAIRSCGTRNQMDQSVEPLRYAPADWSKLTNPRTSSHTLSAGSSADFSSLAAG